MSLVDRVEIPRRVMDFFFIVDTSGSMDGDKIGTVNSAIDEAIPLLKSISDDNPDAEIKVAVLEFSSGAEWVTAGGPLELGDFSWNHMDAGGVTDLGAAYGELADKLSVSHGFMQEATGSLAPVLFLLSDGSPTDNYQVHLKKLKQIGWYKEAIKVAIAIGSDADRDVLREFTGNTETVLTAYDASTLRKIIRFVSVTASKVASKSVPVDSGSEGDGGGGKTRTDSFIDALSEITVETADSADSSVDPEFEW
jgi:uncharacterized protein YegL